MKTVHFYRLDMDNVSTIKDEVKPITKLEDKQNIWEALNKEILKSEDIYIIEAERKKDAVLEITDRKGSLVFGKLCSEQDIRNFQTRDRETLVVNRKAVNPERILEKFSYFLLDTNNFTVCYIKEVGAPKIDYLGYAISNLFDNTSPKKEGRLTPLLDPDVLKTVASKEIIGSIQYEMTIPSWATMDITGLSEEQYRDLQHTKGVKIAVTIRPEFRKKSILTGDETERFKWLSNFFIGKDKVTAKAKDSEESISIDYNLEEHKFIKKINFKDDDFIDIETFDTEIFGVITDEYQKNKQDIESYLGFLK